MSSPDNKVSPHPFVRRGWRFWVCTHCYAPRCLHPRQAWVRARPLDSNHYLSRRAPHFNEGW